MSEVQILSPRPLLTDTKGRTACDLAMEGRGGFRATSVMDGWAATERVPRWLCNELIHVESGREFRSGRTGTPRELPPIYADLMFHGVLSDSPWGGPVLPSTFVFGKGSSRKG